MSVLSAWTLSSGRHPFPCVVPSFSLIVSSFGAWLSTIFMRATEAGFDTSEKQVDRFETELAIVRSLVIMPQSSTGCQVSVCTTQRTFFCRTFQRQEIKVSTPSPIVARTPTCSCPSLCTRELAFVCPINNWLLDVHALSQAQFSTARVLAKGSSKAFILPNTCKQL